jgi:hypothetical protein
MMLTFRCTDGCDELVTIWLTLVHKLITPEHIVDRSRSAIPTTVNSVARVFDPLKYLMLAQQDVMQELPFVINVIEQVKSVNNNLAVAAVHTCRDLVRSHFALKV